MPRILFLLWHPVRRAVREVLRRVEDEGFGVYGLEFEFKVEG